MARIWQIRQSEAPDRYDMDYKKFDSEEENEAYECGYEEGYADAMRKVKGGHMGLRGNYGRRGGSGYRMDDDEMDYRRRRDSRGRYM